MNACRTTRHAAYVGLRQRQIGRQPVYPKANGPGWLPSICKDSHLCGFFIVFVKNADPAAGRSMIHSCSYSFTSFGIVTFPILKVDTMNRRSFALFSTLSALTAAAMLWGCSKPADTKTAAASAASAPASAAAAELPKKIIIGLDDNFPPMGFKNDKNELVGYDIDLAREAGKRLGVEMEFKPIDWSAKEAELNGKRVDALWNGMTITEERKKNVAFTKPYMQNHQIVIVTAKSPIKAKADMAGKVVGVQDGSSAVDAVSKEDISKQFKELKKFGDNVAALMDLSTGRLDAVVVDEVVGRYYTSKKPGEYRVLTDNFGSEDYGVGLRKEDTTLLTKLDAALDAMNADGTAAKIYAKWFEEAKK